MLEIYNLIHELPDLDALGILNYTENYQVDTDLYFDEYNFQSSMILAQQLASGEEDEIHEKEPSFYSVLH